MDRILSFGAGVNTAALLALAYQNKLEIDAVIFADTGAELPETYHWIEKYAKPICEEIGISFITVKGQEKFPYGIFDNLYDYCVYYNIIPTRKWRYCTDKFKIRPITRYLINNFDNPTLLLGIDYSEKVRLRKIYCYDIPCEFPLIDMKIDRKGCKRIIRDAGWEVPPKSGCYFCPFSSIKKFVWLLEEHPDLFIKAEFLEKQNKMYPKLTIKQGIKLEDLRKKKTQSKQMTLEGEFACVMCHI